MAWKYACSSISAVDTVAASSRAPLAKPFSRFRSPLCRCEGKPVEAVHALAVPNSPSIAS